MSEDSTSVTLEDSKQTESNTDWERVGTLTDEEIHEAGESDPDTYLWMTTGLRRRNL